MSGAGRRLFDEIEAHTDLAAWTGGLSALGERGIDDVVSRLRESVAAVVASGLLPALSPTGLPTGS
jgi:hypothetical protein